MKEIGCITINSVVNVGPQYELCVTLCYTMLHCVTLCFNTHKMYLVSI